MLDTSHLGLLLLQPHVFSAARMLVPIQPCPQLHLPSPSLGFSLAHLPPSSPDLKQKLLQDCLLGLLPGTLAWILGKSKRKAGFCSHWIPGEWTLCRLQRGLASKMRRVGGAFGFQSRGKGTLRNESAYRSLSCHGNLTSLLVHRDSRESH